MNFKPSYLISDVKIAWFFWVSPRPESGAACHETGECMIVSIHYIHICMHVCIYVSMNVCLHACVYECVYVCMYVCKYVCMV